MPLPEISALDVSNLQSLISHSALSLCRSIRESYEKNTIN
jgi:hypothetical protein